MEEREEVEEVEEVEEALEGKEPTTGNKRKFKHWDNSQIFHTLQKAIQIQHKIEQECHMKQAMPIELPMSMLPTSVLYELAACYTAMYNKLLEEELIVSGYPRTQYNKH